MKQRLGCKDRVALTAMWWHVRRWLSWDTGSTVRILMYECNPVTQKARSKLSEQPVLLYD